jgi:signal transduction histidine kinase
LLDYHVVGEPHTLPVIVATALFQISVEAAANAVKHARATRLDVELRYDPSVVRVCIRDDGRGFEGGAQPASGRSLGLTSMRERARIAGIELRVESSIGHGTEVLLAAPSR